jgi:hypothetical protein
MSAAEKQREPRQITEKGRRLIACDQVRSSESVPIGGGFIINVNLGDARQPDHNLITSGATFIPQPDAVFTQTDSDLITPDHTRSDQVPIRSPQPDHLIRSFRSDQVIGFGDEGVSTAAPQTYDTIATPTCVVIDSAVARWEVEHSAAAWQDLRNACGTRCLPAEALRTRNVPLVPPGWRLVTCDHYGNPTRYGIYFKVEGPDGVSTDPDQYQPTVLVEAWRRWDLAGDRAFDPVDEEEMCTDVPMT